MSFTFSNKNGETIQQIYSCTECIYISTQKHFRSDNRCPLCYSKSEQINTQTSTNGISTFKYRQLLDHLENNVSGIGHNTRTRIKESFPSGQKFLNAAEQAYQNANYDKLTAINGIGTSTAKQIACGIANHENWNGGAADNPFTFTNS